MRVGDGGAVGHRGAVGVGHLGAVVELLGLLGEGMGLGLLGREARVGAVTDLDLRGSGGGGAGVVVVHGAGGGGLVRGGGLGDAVEDVGHGRGAVGARVGGGAGDALRGRGGHGAGDVLVRVDVHRALDKGARGGGRDEGVGVGVLRGGPEPVEDDAGIHAVDVDKGGALDVLDLLVVHAGGRRGGLAVRVGGAAVRVRRSAVADGLGVVDRVGHGLREVNVQRRDGRDPRRGAGKGEAVHKELADLGLAVLGAVPEPLRDHEHVTCDKEQDTHRDTHTQNKN